jgi:hypothetical protein
VFATGYGIIINLDQAGEQSMRNQRIMAVASLTLALAVTKAEAQQWTDSYKWFIGPQAGVLGFQTPAQTRGWVPTVGMQMNVIARRTGLMVAVDEAIGDKELTAYTDVTTAAGVRDVNFDHIRRYSAVLTAYLTKSESRPYVGFGFGLMQVLNPQPAGFFTSSVQASLAQKLASQKSTSGFLTLVGGLQFKLGSWRGFAQYQLTSAPESGMLLRGPSHGFSGGFRWSLGSARESVRGGGY